MQACQVSPYAIIEAQPTLLAKLHDAGGGQALRERRDAKAVAGRERFAAEAIGIAESPLQGDLAMMRDGNHAARLPGQAQLEFQP
jgi:hypothetical protein